MRAPWQKTPHPLKGLQAVLVSGTTRKSWRVSQHKKAPLLHCRAARTETESPFCQGPWCAPPNVCAKTMNWPNSAAPMTANARQIGKPCCAPFRIISPLTQRTMWPPSKLAKPSVFWGRGFQKSRCDVVVYLRDWRPQKNTWAGPHGGEKWCCVSLCSALFCIMKPPDNWGQKSDNLVSYAPDTIPKPATLTPLDKGPIVP
jgi:hypothetical protein